MRAVIEHGAARREGGEGGGYCGKSGGREGGRGCRAYEPVVREREGGTGGAERSRWKFRTFSRNTVPKWINARNPPRAVHYGAPRKSPERAFIFANAGHELPATSSRIAMREFASIMQVRSSGVYVMRDNSEPAARAYFTMITEPFSSPTSSPV